MTRGWRLAVRAIPDWPRRRYNTFTGTNSWSEWRAAFGQLAAGTHADPATIERYEDAFARRTGCSRAFSFGAGRMALYCLLDALELKPGDEIVLPAFTCVVVPNAMLYRGLRPVFVDIEPRTFNLDPALVEQAITPRTRAIYAQHSFGVSCDIERIAAIAERHGLFVIEDAAHSLGAVHRGRAHGSLGRAAFFSTDRTKVINTHLGGMATTNDPGLAERIAEVQRRTPFLSARLARAIQFSFLSEFLLYAPAALWIGRPVASALRRLGLLAYWSDELSTVLPRQPPYPNRLSAGQALLGLSQLEDLPRNLAHRRRLAAWLEQRIRWYGDSLGGAFLDQAWLRYSFMVEDRDAFDRRVKERFDIPFWFTSVVYGRDRDLHLAGYRSGSCPVAEVAARHAVNFPTHLRIPLSALEALWERHGTWIEKQVRRVPELSR